VFNRALIVVTMGILLAGVIHVCICTELCSGISIFLYECARGIVIFINSYY